MAPLGASCRAAGWSLTAASFECGIQSYAASSAASESSTP
jgi:hypothetical protein